MPVSDIFHDDDHDLVYTGVHHVPVEEKRVGLDGIKKLFEADPDDQSLPRQTSVLVYGFFTSMLGAGIINGGYYAKWDWIKFAESNAQAKYQNEQLARNALMAKTYGRFVTSGVDYGVRFASAYACLMIPSIIIPAFRGEYKPYDMTLGGLLCGCYWHNQQGLKKMAKAGATGAAAATIAGFCIWGLTTGLGITADDILYPKKANFLRQKEYIENKLADPVKE